MLPVAEMTYVDFPEDLPRLLGYEAKWDEGSSVHPERQGKGAGRELLDAAEGWIREEGRSRVYVETSTRAQYAGTRGFYLACGYELAAELADFYAPGDGKATFLKVLSA